MRKYLAPVLLILALASIGAVAQTIVRAIQLSQDTTGAFGVDANNNVYFPSHILSTGIQQPAPSVTGTGTPTVTGTDTAGTITMGSSATAAVLAFGRAWLSTPSCVLTSQTAYATTAPHYTITTTNITIAQTSTSGNIYNYHCFSVS